MSNYYSFTDRCFYNDVISPRSVIGDAHKLDDADYLALLDGVASGKLIIEGIDGSPVLTDAEVKPEDIKNNISATRYNHEILGININGFFVDTGRDSQALITGAALSAFMDDTYVCNWKTPDGFVEIDAPTLISVSKAVRVHVQACFDREAALLKALAAGTYTDAMLDEGWPA
jgi:hypothetical protein